MDHNFDNHPDAVESRWPLAAFDQDSIFLGYCKGVLCTSSPLNLRKILAMMMMMMMMVMRMIMIVTVVTITMIITVILLLTIVILVSVSLLLLLLESGASTAIQLPELRNPHLRAFGRRPLGCSVRLV